MAARTEGLIAWCLFANNIPEIEYGPKKLLPELCIVFMAAHNIFTNKLLAKQVGRQESKTGIVGIEFANLEQIEPVTFVMRQ